MVLGLDIGFGHTKVCCAEEKFKFPTQLAFAPDDPNMEIEIVNIVGNKYIIGKDTKHSTYRLEIPNVEYLIKYAPVFLKYVLNKIPDIDVVVTGLPPNCKRYIEPFVENLKTVFSGHIEVLPQGIGILYDTENKLDSEAIIIDIGYNTVDCISVEKDEDENWRKKRAVTIENFGVMKAVEILRELIPANISILKGWSPSRLLECFEKGYIFISGEKISLEQYKKDSILKYTEILMSKIDQELKDVFRETPAVVLAGGGAYYVDDKSFGKNVIIPESPEFSQARGYYLAGQSIS